MSKDILAIFTNKSTEIKNILPDAIPLQTHIGIMSVHNNTAYFERDFQVNCYAEEPINPSAAASTTFFRADDKSPEQQVAYFDNINTAVGMNAVILITDGNGWVNAEAKEIAQRVKILMPDMPVVMAWQFSALRDIIDHDTAEAMYEQSRGNDAKLTVRNGGAFFTCKSYGADDSELKMDTPNIMLPDNVDYIISSGNLGKAFIDLAELTKRNPHAPLDEDKCDIWAYNLVREYKTMPAVKKAIYDMQHNILEHKPKEFAAFSA